MAPTKMVTRCPQCGTSFRITPAQLQSARGAVRCGACLHIFKARDNLVGSPAPKTESALVRKPNPKGATASEAPATPRDTTRRQSAAKTSGPAATTKPAPPAKPSQSPDAGSSKLSFDQSMIDEESKRLEEDDFLISDDMDRPKKDEEDDFFGVGGSVRPTHSLFDRNLQQEKEEASEPGDDTDESWAMSLLAEEEQSAETDDPGPPKDPEPPADFDLMEEPAPPTSEEEEAQIRFHLEEEKEATGNDYQTERLSARDPERSALLMNIDPEPVEMDWSARQGRATRRWLWPSLAVLALLTLVVQVAWLQFDRLSRLEPYRSVYAAVCPLVGCELPTLVDRSQIRAYNLVVRNHPERDNALVVDAILLNTAPFAQPFPALVLEFSDLNGTRVAARQFRPSEYLSGELAGRTRMPSNQPVHLTLELVDPGENAVNYRAYIPE